MNGDPIVIQLILGLVTAVGLLAVVFAEDVFDSGATAFGVMLTMIGVGAVVTAPFIAGRGASIVRSRLEAVALLAYTIGLLSFAIAPVLPVAYVALLMVGAAHLTSATVLNTTIQVQVPEARRAKVLSVHMMIVTLSSPVGQLVLGQIMDVVGPRATMIGACVTMGVIASFFIASGRLVRLDADGPEPI